LKDDQSSSQRNAGGDAPVSIVLPGQRSHLVDFIIQEDLVAVHVVVVPVQDGGGEVASKAHDIQDGCDKEEGVTEKRNANDGENADEECEDRESERNSDLVRSGEMRFVEFMEEPREYSD